MADGTLPASLGSSVGARVACKEHPATGEEIRNDSAVNHGFRSEMIISSLWSDLLLPFSVAGERQSFYTG